MKKVTVFEDATVAVHPLAIISGVIVVVSGTVAGAMTWIAIGDNALLKELNQLFLGLLA